MSACAGEISSSTPAPESHQGSNHPTTSSPNSADSSVDASDTPIAVRPPEETGFAPGDEAATDFPSITTRVARLTHTQWRNTVADLLYLDSSVDYTDLLREDPRQAGFLFDNDGSTLVVDGALLSGYERAASELAALVTLDSAQLAKITPPDSTDLASRITSFIDAFVIRAHRHPPSDEDRADYESLFAMGPALYDGMDDFAAGVRAVVEGALLSPHFLYRVEQSQDVSGEVIPLDGYEVAARLSYALWNTMPDTSLLEAAAAGTLTKVDAVETQARRMLEDPRAAEVLLAFHDQLLEANKFSNIQPSSTFYDVSPELGDHARTEQTMYLRDLLFDNEGTLGQLLTGTDTFVNQELASIYGLTGTFNDEFQKAQLDPQSRAGIFTHIGFLAANATSVDPDPIHRGKFLAERMACLSISAPPVMIPPPPKVSNKTNRQLIEEYTQADGSECAACHKPLINPYGFPFENFDAIGALRTTDQGFPVQTDASPLIDGTPTDVADAVELATAMASSEGVHACYVQHALEFLYGRHHTTNDESLISRLAQASLADDTSVRELLLGLVRTEAFLTRNVKEEL